MGDQVDRTDEDTVVDPFEDTDGNGSVQAFDAARGLQHILDPPLLTLTGLDALSADVAEFGIITAFNAAFILKKVVGLITVFPVQEATSAKQANRPPLTAQLFHSSHTPVSKALQITFPFLLNFFPLSSSKLIFPISYCFPPPSGTTFDK